MRKIGKIFKFLIPVIALATLGVFMIGAGRRERATVEKNKALVMRKLEVWNKGDMALADEVYSSDTIRYIDTAPEGSIRGRDALKQYIMAVRTAWPDMHITVIDMFAQGDKVALHWAFRGTSTGVVEGWPPPTGKEMVFEGVDIYRFADGKLVEDWCFQQDLAMFYQWGMKLVPAQ